MISTILQVVLRYTLTHTHRFGPRLSPWESGCRERTLRQPAPLPVWIALGTVFATNSSRALSQGRFEPKATHEDHGVRIQKTSNSHMFQTTNQMMLPVLTFTHLLLCSTGDNCKNIFPWGKPQWNIGIPNKQPTNLQWYDQHVPHLSETWHFWAVQHAVFRDITGSPNFPDYWRSILVPRLFCGNESPTAPWTMFLISCLFEHDCKHIIHHATQR